MSDDEPSEIISRPPSHPIATTLLIVSMLGTILAISFVWAELYGEYLPTPGPTGAGASSKVIAERHIKDHYTTNDDGKPSGYKATGGDELMKEIEKELNLTETIGGDEASDG